MAYKLGRKVSKTKLFHIEVSAAERLEAVAREANLSQTELLEAVLTEPGVLEQISQKLTSPSFTSEEVK